MDLVFHTLGLTIAFAWQALHSSLAKELNPFYTDTISFWYPLDGRFYVQWSSMPILRLTIIGMYPNRMLLRYSRNCRGHHLRHSEAGYSFSVRHWFLLKFVVAFVWFFCVWRRIFHALIKELFRQEAKRVHHHFLAHRYLETNHRWFLVLMGFQIPMPTIFIRKNTITFLCINRVWIYENKRKYIFYIIHWGLILGVKKKKKSFLHPKWAPYVIIFLNK